MGEPAGGTRGSRVNVSVDDGRMPLMVGGVSCYLLVFVCRSAATPH